MKNRKTITVQKKLANGQLQRLFGEEGDHYAFSAFQCPGFPYSLRLSNTYLLEEDKERLDLVVTCMFSSDMPWFRVPGGDNVLEFLKGVKTLRELQIKLDAQRAIELALKI